jgi:hypothetical protein
MWLPGGALEMDARYPEVDPYDHGHPDVGDGNAVYWEACGNPDGRPALVLHGGPGSGCAPGMRRYFDPAAYRIVLFDRRGCRRSKPHVSDPEVSLAANTTQHQLADILAGAWPGCELVLIEETGHSGSITLDAAIVAATGKFAASGAARHG